MLHIEYTCKMSCADEEMTLFSVAIPWMAESNKCDVFAEGMVRFSWKQVGRKVCSCWRGWLKHARVLTSLDALANLSTNLLLTPPQPCNLLLAALDGQSDG